MKKKIIRNVLGLVCFLVALIAMIQLGKWLLNKKTDLENFDSNVAAMHIGYRQMRYRNYEIAISHFDQVLRDDPYNGVAMFGRAIAFRKLFYSAAVRANADPVEQKQTAEDAIAAFQKCIDFPRYRNLAYHNISRIYAHQRDTDRAIEYMEKAVENGYYTRYGWFMSRDIDRDFYYRHYWQKGADNKRRADKDPRWRKIKRMEKENAGGQ